MNHFKKYSLDRSNSPIENRYWVGAVISAGASILNGLMNRKSSSDIDERNLQFQKDKLEYEKQLQKQIFQREDTAYQRTADDMRAAGLNPLSMNGTNGAGEVISTSAPQSDIHSGDLNADFSSLSNLANEFYQNTLNREAVKSAKFDNAIKAATMESEIDKINKGNKKDSRTFDFMNRYGLTDISPEWQRSITTVQNLIDSGKYLSMLDTAKKAANNLSGFSRGAFKDAINSATKDLIAGLGNSFVEPDELKFPWELSYNEKGNKAAHAPKPKMTTKDFLFDKDYSFGNKKKMDNTRKNNENYWKNYAKSYSK